MDEKIWFYAVGSEQKGPIDPAELDMLIAASTIGPDTLMWREGMNDWMAAAAALPDNLMPSTWSRPATPPPPPPPRTGMAPIGTAQSSYSGVSPDHPTQFMDCVKTVFNRYAKFSGRSRRSEFWYFALFNFLVSLVLGIVDATLFGLDSVSPLRDLYSLAVIVPWLSVGARRLHDIGRSGWWQLIVFIPLVGIIVLIVWFASRGKDEDNEYGPA